MKRVICLLAMVMSLQGAFAQKYSFKDLVGNWRTKDGAGLEVVDSFRIYVVYQDKKKLLVNYSTDFTSNPAKFNFVLRDGSGLVNVKSQMLFVNDDLVQWQVTDSDAKPVGYNGNTQRRDVLMLRRVEERSN